MTATKPKLDPRKLQPISGRERMTIDHPVEVTQKPTGEDAAERVLDFFDETRADHNQLKHYWLTGEGAGKWATWTELYHHLRKHMVDELAKRVAAEWFHERYGIWPGADLNRVKHGKPPRGHEVGPG